MTGTGPILIVMRLADMHRVHPLQDDSHVCSKCGERVGVYPSGQDLIRTIKGIALVCQVCRDIRPGETLILAPGGEAEASESRPIARR